MYIYLDDKLPLEEWKLTQQIKAIYERHQDAAKKEAKPLEDKMRQMELERLGTGYPTPTREAE